MSLSYLMRMIQYAAYCIYSVRTRTSSPDRPEKPPEMTERSRKPGRPRDAETHHAVLVATRRLLLSEGYHNLTIEAVAQLAGTTRSTIYRWWPTRGALALEAAAEHLDIGTVPDTGGSVSDVRIAIRQLTETFSDPLAGIVIMAAIANIDGDDEMATKFRKEIVYPWRATAAGALDRAVERGDLPSDTDIQFVLNVIVGTVFQCTITPAQPTIEGMEDGLVRMVFGQVGTVA